MGRTIQARNPNLGSISYARDDASNITATTDARGVTLRREYDGLNRIKRRWDEANREGSLVTWRYDRLPEGCDRTECTNLPGELAAIEYPLALVADRTEVGSDRFGYDVRRRTVFQGRRFGQRANLSTRIRYDNLDRVVSTAHPDGTVIERSYDGLGRLAGIPGYITVVGYEGRNLRDRLVFANGASMRVGYDDLMRMASMSHADGSGTAFYELTLTRNRVDNVVEVADDAGSPVSLSAAFEVDDWYRTTGATYADKSESFRFDALDRVLAIDGAEQSYDREKPLAVSAMGNLIMSYDASGNLIQRNGRAFGRDELGRIATIEVGGTEHGVHAYNDQLRVVQVTTEGTLVFYGFNRFEVRDGVGTTFVDAGGARVARREGIELATVIYGDGNENGVVGAGDALSASDLQSHILGAAAMRLLLEGDDERTFLHLDHMGSHVAATDQSGELRGQQAFTMHGRVRASTGYVGAYGFTGQEQDLTTDLIHMANRELDPMTGRWDRFDPAFVTLDSEAMTRLGACSTGYAFVANNPATHTDPSGLGKFSDLFRRNKRKGQSSSQSPMPYRKRKEKKKKAVYTVASYAYDKNYKRPAQGAFLADPMDNDVSSGPALASMPSRVAASAASSAAPSSPPAAPSAPSGNNSSAPSGGNSGSFGPSPPSNPSLSASGSGGLLSADSPVRVTELMHHAIHGTRAVMLRKNPFAKEQDIVNAQNIQMNMVLSLDVDVDLL